MENQTLGIGRIIATCLNVLVLRFQLLVTIAGSAVFVNFLAEYALGALMGGDGANLEDTALGYFGIAASYVIDSITSAFVSAFVIMMTYDLMLDRPSNPPVYLQKTKENLVPIVMVSTLSGLAVGLASLAFVIPGLVLATIWFVVVPVVVIENSGMNAFRRSAELTKGHRWPIFGFILLLSILILILAVVIETAIPDYPLLSGIVTWTYTGFTYVLFALGSAVIYARLREIKEGISVNDLADIFS